MLQFKITEETENLPVQAFEGSNVKETSVKRKNHKEKQEGKEPKHTHTHTQKTQNTTPSALLPRVILNMYLLTQL